MTQIIVQATNETLPAGAIYASPTGSSSAAGTYSAPTSFATAYSRAVAGGTIVLLGGIYRLAALFTVGKRINFIAYPGSAPILSGASVISSGSFLYESASAAYYLPNYTVTLPIIAADYADPDYPLSVNQQQVFINNQYLAQVTSKALLVPGTFYVQEGSTRRLYIKDNPAGKTVEITSAKGGLQFTAGGSASKVVGIGIEKFAVQNVYVGAVTSLTLDRCSVWHSSQHGVYINDGANVTCVNCWVNYNGGNGYQVTAQDGHRVEGGQVCFNNLAHFAKEWNAAGIKQSGDKVPLSSYVPNTYTGITVSDNDCVGIWTDVNSRDTTVSKCRVARNTNGIFIEISKGIKVVDNLVTEQGVGIYIAESEDCKVYNNTISLNKECLRVKDTTRTSEATGYQWKVRNLEFCNNILDRRDAPSTTAAMVYTTLSGGRTTTSAQMFSKLNANAIYRSALDSPTYLYRWYQTPGNVSLYPYLVDFRTANPTLELDAVIVTPQATHPYFVSDTSYVVLSTSPTLGAGVAVTGDVATILGVASGTVVDIGSTLS